jgi:predicted signal transduction protein with EAL and GGDEF domain
MCLSFIVFAAESLAAIVYFLFSPRDPNTTALEVVASIGLFAAIGSLPFVTRVAKLPWRWKFSLGMALASGILLAACCYLDDGLDSPLIALLVLPVINAAFALSIRAVALCSMAAAVELALVAATDANITDQSVGRLFLLIAFVAGMVALALGWASNRTRLQGVETSLRADLIRFAQTDGLTGCVNQGSFFERLDSEIERARRNGQALSLLMTDVDLFKAFNDVHGHAEGDKALATVASFMKRSCRIFDIVARVGGDELL